MSQTQHQSPEVVITNVFEYRGREVQRAECLACGKCALVPTVDIGTPDQDANLLRGNMCADAILAAATSLKVDTL